MSNNGKNSGCRGAGRDGRGVEAPDATGRGVSLPAKPCSFVRRHHVCRSGWASGGGGVVLHRPQTLVPSSGGTTSIASDGPSAAGTWCFTARKPLFLRPEAPRLSTKGPPDAMGRGASLPASPCSFVRKHHVCRAGWAFGGWDVVLHCPQTLIPSYGGTTSIGSDGPSAAGTWCFTARKPLFLRPEAPRLSVRMGLRRRRRGASLPAKPCSFVLRHHVYRAGWAFGGWDVVLHCPQTLIPSYGSTTASSSRAAAFMSRSTHRRSASFPRPGWDEVGNGTAVSLSPPT